MFPEGGGSWTLDFCEDMLNHAISLKVYAWGGSIFTFLYKFIGIIGRKRLTRQSFWIIIWVYNYLLNGIRLDQDLDNSCWIRKFATNSTRNCFLIHQTQPDLGKWNLIVLLTAQQIIQVSFQTSLIVSLLGYNEMI